VAAAARISREPPAMVVATSPQLAAAVTAVTAVTR
jgi:hypothetical protein